MGTVNVMVRWQGGSRDPSGVPDQLAVELPSGLLYLSPGATSAPLRARYMTAAETPSGPLGLKVYGVGVYGLAARKLEVGTLYWDCVSMHADDAVKLVRCLLVRRWGAAQPHPAGFAEVVSRWQKHTTGFPAVTAACLGLG